MDDLHSLVMRLSNADLTPANPGIQNIIELELAKWVRSYEGKKHRKVHDCYGGPGDIPDQIILDGKVLSPYGILSHVRARDPLGMRIIRQVYDNWTNDPGRESLADIIAPLRDGMDLDEAVFKCQCGKHDQSWRGILEGIINADPDSPFLRIGYPDAVMRLYGAPEKPSRGGPAPWYRRLGVAFRSIFS